MKKLTTLFFILFFLAVGLFAEPLIIPKNYENTDVPYFYIDDNLTTSYMLMSFSEDTNIKSNQTNNVKITPNKLEFYKSTSNVSILLEIYFTSESELDIFISKYFNKSYEIPETFSKMRKFAIDKNASEQLTVDEINNNEMSMIYTFIWK